MSDLVERLRAKRIYGVFEIERQRHEAADEIERLTAAIMRIEAINDNPADFNVEIDEVCRPFTSTELPYGIVGEAKEGPSNAADYGNSEREIRKRDLKARTDAISPQDGRPTE